MLLFSLSNYPPEKDPIEIVGKGGGQNLEGDWANQLSIQAAIQVNQSDLLPHFLTAVQQNSYQIQSKIKWNNVIHREKAFSAAFMFI